MTNGIYGDLCDAFSVEHDSRQTLVRWSPKGGDTPATFCDASGVGCLRPSNR
jgi:hypothetical protein